MTAQHLLLVDEDPAMHSSLRRLLRRPGREIHFAGSGAEALEQLQRLPIAVVLCDLALRDTGGIALLKKIQAEYPACIRLVLSGQLTQEDLEHLLSSELAAEILQKPWENEQLEEMVAAALQLATDQSDSSGSLKPHLNALAGLPALPAIHQELSEVLQERDSVSIERIAAVIVRDSAILSRLLHWANTSIFGQPRRVETPERAVILLGITLVEALVLSHGAFTVLRQTAPAGYDPGALQRHSLVCGHTARLLLRDRGAPAQEADRAFTAGLLHDIGKMAANSCLHGPFSLAVARARTEKDLLRNAERQVLGATHAQVGAHVAELWNLPPYLRESIRWHHAPDRAAPSSRPIVEAVHLADALAQRPGPGENASGNFRPPQVSPRVWRASSLDRKAADALALRVMEALS